MKCAAKRASNLVLGPACWRGIIRRCVAAGRGCAHHCVRGRWIIHVTALEAMGAQIDCATAICTESAGGLKGAPGAASPTLASVRRDREYLMAATLAKGTDHSGKRRAASRKSSNLAAAAPAWLRRSEGEGTSTITIQGVDVWARRRTPCHRPDRSCGTYMLGPCFLRRAKSNALAGAMDLVGIFCRTLVCEGRM